MRSVLVRRDVDRGAWEGRPWAAASLRAITRLLPITLSVAATWFVSTRLPPVDSFVERVGLWVVLSALATGVLLAVDRMARRLLPLAALLKLSLVFPDQAPSRFRTALRTGTVHQLQDRVEHIKEHGFDPDQVRAAEQLLELIAALSAHDRLTRGHAERVRAYSRMIGEELGLPEDDLDKLHWAGLLHDVGKLFVPAEILNKTGRLTDEEFEIIKGHPGWGAELCEPLRPWLGDWVDAVGQHHERWDGRGYPNGLAGEDISLAARIVSVADVFDVITSARSYKAPMSATDGRMELTACAGTQFDAEVVRAFLTVGLGRLRLVMGPLSWLTQLPVIGRMPVGPALGAAGSAAATALAVTLGLLNDPDPAPAARVAESVPAEAEAASDATSLADPPEDDLDDDAPIDEPGEAAETAPSVPPDLPAEPAPAEPVGPVGPPDPGAEPPPEPPPPPPPPPAAPVALDDVATVNEDDSVVIAVLANDTDADGDSLTVTSVFTAAGIASTDGASLTYTPAPNAVGTHTIGYTVADGTGRTDSALVTVTVSPLPDAPVAADDTATVAEDSTVVVTVLGNDGDVDGDTLTVTAASSSDGTATTDGTTVSYSPAPDAVGTHTVSYTVDDGTGLTDTATIIVTVTPTPDVPIAQDDAATVLEDGTVVVSVLANDGDVDGDTLTVSAASSSDGLATTDGTTVTYSPAPDSFGTHTVSYTVDDGTGLTDTATITVTVTAVADAPVAGDDTAMVAEDGMVVVSVLGNDSDVDGDGLTVTATSSADGTATTDGTTVSYSPAPDAVGTHTVSYTVDDGTGLTDTATITVTVTPVVDAPLAQDDVATVAEDGTVVVSVLGNDSDIDGDGLTVTAANSGDGTATTDGTTVTYSPAPDAHGTHTVSYTVDDGTGLTDTATITVTVTPAPDAPVAGDDSATVAEDGTVVVPVLGNDSDIDGDGLTVTIASSGDGTATTDGTTVSYSPAPDAFGTHTVSYTVDDGTGLTDSATITVTVTPTPDAPVAGDDSATVAEDGTVVVSVLGNDSDIDGDGLTVTVTTSADGTASTDGTTVSYSPAPDAHGTHTVSYTVDDGTGLTDTATITVTVTPAPDAPVAGDDTATVAEDGMVVVSVLGNDGDIDGDGLTVTVTSSADGTATTDGTTVSYSPAPDTVGTHTVSYTVDDGTGLTDTATVTVTVTPVNDAPSFTAGADVTVAEDSGPTTLAGWASGITSGPADESGQAVTFTATPADPSLFDIAPALDATGTLTFTFAADANGSTTVSVQAVDDGGTAGGGVDASAAHVLTITVTPVADAPVAGDDAYATSMAIPLLVPAPGVLANDGDEDGDTLTANLTISAGGGIVLLLPDGSFTYTPFPLFSGTDTFTYTVTDGGLTDTATVTIQVDSTSSQSTLYLGTSGSGPDDWSFVTSPPAGTGTEADTDGDGNPGVTLNKSDQKLTNTDGEDYQEWGVVTPTNLVLDGPVSLQLWSTSEGFDPDHDNDYSVWLQDCAADGTGCVTIASSVNVHVSHWNGGVEDWVYREISLGDVSHTVTAGRMLQLRVMTEHHDLWIASSAAHPSALVITQP